MKFSRNKRFGSLFVALLVTSTTSFALQPSKLTFPMCHFTTTDRGDEKCPDTIKGHQITKTGISLNYEVVQCMGGFLNYKVYCSSNVGSAKLIAPNNWKKKVPTMYECKQEGKDCSFKTS